MWKIIGFLWFCLMQDKAEGKTLEIGPNNFIPDEDNIDVVDVLPLDNHTEYYLTAFKPKINGTTVHHFGLYACESPHKSKEKQGSLNIVRHLTDYFVCNNAAIEFLYGYTEDTNGFTFPEDVSYEVGGSTKFKFLATDIHYRYKGENVSDSSKIEITYQTKRTRYTATSFSLTSMKRHIMRKNASYVITMIKPVPVKMFPLFALVHTHDLGTKVTGYVVRRNTSSPEEDRWIKITSRNPQPPQRFEKTETTEAMEPGDILVARCHYFNYKDKDQKMGKRHVDEMCDLILINAVEYGYVPLDDESTKKEMPPEEYGLRNMPEDA